ncbi:hypothetical protein [Gracilibacillus thailandensis]|uniref:DUF4386 family protein n=1 Tax=Gracilibacillus thailandensis TaxID=563735 RepID=A0A6N7R5K5_9BACI|nr:hypothetical protein [Gracilibacillus thailandensis]MRI68434.1 hypothetical protein [Gracilibacillus thailandensis]
MNNNKGRITKTGLIRWAGLFAILAGILYIVIQFIHPADNISSVNSDSWVMVACLTVAMSIFNLIGIIGIYSRQVEESGWLGLVGFLLFSLFWLASTAFSFIEAFVLPMLTNDAPEYVAGFLGIFGGNESEVNLGILPALAPIAGGLYTLGGLLLGIATFRANVLPRLAAALLAIAAVVTLAAAIIPHPLDRLLAIPMGAALIWLGYALWSGREKSIKKLSNVSLEV